MSTVTKATETSEYILDATMRCDRCGSQAYFCVEFPSTLSLLFCKHDYDENKSKLEQLAINIVDESYRLVHNKLVD